MFVEYTPTLETMSILLEKCTVFGFYPYLPKLAPGGTCNVYENEVFWI